MQGAGRAELGAQQGRAEAYGMQQLTRSDSMQSAVASTDISKYSSVASTSGWKGPARAYTLPASLSASVITSEDVAETWPRVRRASAQVGTDCVPMATDCGRRRRQVVLLAQHTLAVLWAMTMPLSQAAHSTLKSTSCMSDPFLCTVSVYPAVACNPGTGVQRSCQRAHMVLRISELRMHGRTPRRPASRSAHGDWCQAAQVWRYYSSR